MQVNTIMKSVCVPPRCGLCRFGLQFGDNIVAVRPLDAERSQPYEHHIVGLTDTARGMQFFECRGRCHHDEQRVACHVYCIGITPNNASLSKIFTLTAYAFGPTLITEKRRIHWFRFHLTGILKTSTRHILHLPEEVLHSIAAWALESQITCRRLAIDYANKACNGTIRVKSSVKTGEKIYARYIEFEDIILFDPSLTESIDSLYVSNDHLGIRQLLFAHSSEQSTIKQTVGVWWRALKLESLGDLLLCHSDGLKLRDLHGATTAMLPRVFFDLPQFSHRRVRCESLCKADPSYHISTVSCNNPQTTAYSLCWNRNIVMLHAHRAKENLDFYQDLQTTDEAVLWLFMPLQTDEVLTQIWRFNGPFKSAIALLVCLVLSVALNSAHILQLVTNQGRSNFLGVQPRTNWDHSDCTLLDLPSKSPSCIYAETTTFGIRTLGFETPKPEPQDRPPMIEWPNSSYPISRPHEYFAWNRTQLNDVVEVVPCYGLSHGKTIIIGLLFHYADGKTASVGQIRLDRLGKVLIVDSDCKLWLGFWQSDDGPCVSHAVLAPKQPRLLDCDSWLEVEWCDDLEWWFSNRQCQLSHQGRLSPSTTMLGKSRF
ncbi:hypothetical protein LX36DRAFT_390852 [Colletotrichum falcatum]|nr:hypothetical protein LX36DRAFT_390852 [Colletotrichum falcatum]